MSTISEFVRMKRLSPSEEKCIAIASLCRQAVDRQTHRQSHEGYGVDDYSEGRIIGAANLARQIHRILTRGDLLDRRQPEGSSLRSRLRVG